MNSTNDIISVLKDFNNISGFRISIHDINYNEIYSYPKNISPFCSKIQNADHLMTKCSLCDRTAFKRVKESGKTYVYQCESGLFEAVAPIYNYGVLSAFLMMGQVRSDNDENKRVIFKKTHSLFKDREEFESYFKKINAIDYNKINSYINIMSMIAETVTRNNKIISRHDTLAEKIEKYLNKNYMNNITLESLSEQFECSKSTLMNSYKKQYNTTIINSLNNKRLDNAKKLVTNTDMSYKQISYECGFYDQNYFSKLFSEKYSLSPTEFRLKTKQD